MELFGGGDGEEEEEDVRGDLEQVRHFSDEDGEMGRNDGVDSDGDSRSDDAVVYDRGSENKWKYYNARNARSGGNGDAGGIVKTQKENMVLVLVRGGRLCCFLI